MDKMQEALTDYGRLMRDDGMENGMEGHSRLFADVEIAEAESAVMTLYEAEKAIADGLAEVLADVLIDPCRKCDYEGNIECMAHPKCANTRREDALDAYQKAREVKMSKCVNCGRENHNGNDICSRCEEAYWEERERQRQEDEAQDQMQREMAEEQMRYAEEGR